MRVASKVIKIRAVDIQPAEHQACKMPRKGRCLGRESWFNCADIGFVTRIGARQGSGFEEKTTLSAWICASQRDLVQYVKQYEILVTITK